MDVVELLKIVIGITLTILTAMISYWVKRQDKRLDDHDDRLDHIEKNIINRREFDGTVKSLREEISAGNKSTHSRLDQIYTLLANKKD